MALDPKQTTVGQIVYRPKFGWLAGAILEVTALDGGGPNWLMAKQLFILGGDGHWRPAKNLKPATYAYDHLDMLTSVDLAKLMEQVGSNSANYRQENLL